MEAKDGTASATTERIRAREPKFASTVKAVKETYAQGSRPFAAYSSAACRPHNDFALGVDEQEHGGMPASKRTRGALEVRTILDSLDSALDAGTSHQPPSGATPLSGMRSSSLTAASPISPFSMSQGSLFSGAASRSPFAIGGSALAAPAAPASSLSLADLEAMIEPEAAFGTSTTCRPHSLADLHERLATFSNAQTWFCKPSAASPLECARAGWEIDGTDMLACRVQPPLPHAPTAHSRTPTPPSPRPYRPSLPVPLPRPLARPPAPLTPTCPHTTRATPVLPLTTAHLDTAAQPPLLPCYLAPLLPWAWRASTLPTMASRCAARASSRPPR